ncbi:MAG: ATP-binding protein [Phycisphaerae bacterium]|nr:ATP-binding protein [Phycisphaerae bacterium]
MKGETINPFLNRNKVTSSEEFFGRKKEIAKILDRITYPEPQSVAVIGERRSGKSSLLTHIYHLLSEQKADNPGDNKLVCIFLDPEEIATEHASDMTWVIIDELVSENQSLLEYIRAYPPRDKEKAIPERHPRIILKNLLKEACKDKYRFVFIIDEFELLAKNKELSESGYLQYMRGISDNYALAFVTSSRKSLEEICLEHNVGASPFDNNFSSPLYLGLLKENECKELIQGALKKFGCEPNYLSPFEEEAIELAGEHPYF